VIEQSLAQTAHEPTTSSATASRGYRARADRALALFEERGHLIRAVASDTYSVPSSGMLGKRYTVRYGGEVESCTCPDHSYHPEVSCKHLLAVGIMHAARRSGVREVRTVRVAACDGIAYRAKTSCHCYGGYHYIGVEEDGQEHEEAVPCKHCHQEGR
jgi:hypothetical protein